MKKIIWSCVYAAVWYCMVLQWLWTWDHCNMIAKDHRGDDNTLAPFLLTLIGTHIEEHLEPLCFRKTGAIP